MVSEMWLVGVAGLAFVAVMIVIMASISRYWRDEGRHWTVNGWYEEECRMRERAFKVSYSEGSKYWREPTIIDVYNNGTWEDVKERFHRNYKLDAKYYGILSDRRQKERMDELWSAKGAGHGSA